MCVPTLQGFRLAGERGSFAAASCIAAFFRCGSGRPERRFSVSSHKLFPGAAAAAADFCALCPAVQTRRCSDCSKTRRPLQKCRRAQPPFCQPPSRCFAIFPANRPSLPGFFGNFAGCSASSCRSDFAKCSAGLQTCIAFLQGSSVEFAPSLYDVHKIALAFLAIRSILWVVRTRAPLFHHTSLQAALHERSSLCPFCLLLLHLVSPISPPWSA